MTNKFLQRLSEFQVRGMKHMMAIMVYLADGNLSGPPVKTKHVNSSKGFDFTAYFVTKFFPNRNILFNVGVEKVPIMDRKERITRY